MIPFDYCNIFQMGWFNRQLENIYKTCWLVEIVRREAGLYELNPIGFFQSRVKSSELTRP